MPEKAAQCLLCGELVHKTKAFKYLPLLIQRHLQPIATRIKLQLTETVILNIEAVFACIKNNTTRTFLSVFLVYSYMLMIYMVFTM